MFCPKCGIVNPDNGKFCRSCGVSLAEVSAALTGKLTTTKKKKHGDNTSAMDNSAPKTPTELYEHSIKSIISGIGFLIVAVALFVTNVAGGQAWWWAMLFPAFGLLSKGISEYLRFRKFESTNVIQGLPQSVDHENFRSQIAESRTKYVSSVDSRYKTGDLVPPSVVENTTRHLEINSEGETVTLKKPS